MDGRAHAVLARSAGFCFGLAGFLLVSPRAPFHFVSHSELTRNSSQSIFSALFSAMMYDKKTRSKLSPVIPPARPRRRRSIPTITMTRADDGNMDLFFHSRPSLYRSAPSPELATIPASSFLRPPTLERRKKRSVVKTLLCPD